MGSNKSLAGLMLEVDSNYEKEIIITKNNYTSLSNIKIDKKKCETLFKKSGIMTIKLNNDKLLEFYQFIVTHYVLDDNKNSSTPSGAIYNFHPKFFYKKERPAHYNWSFNISHSLPKTIQTPALPFWRRQ